MKTESKFAKMKNLKFSSTVRTQRIGRFFVYVLLVFWDLPVIHFGKSWISKWKVNEDQFSTDWVQ